MSHCQEINKDIVDAHIALYVNKYSISLENTGKLAVERLLNRINSNIDISSIFVDDIYVNS